MFARRETTSLALFAVASLGLVIGGSQASASPITAGEATFAYEGDNVPAGGGWDSYTNTFGGVNTNSTSGGIWTSSLDITGNFGTQFQFAQKNAVVNSLSFTIDWHVARPVTATGGAVFQASGPQLDLFVDLDGAGGATNARRLIFDIGESSTFADYTNTDAITVNDSGGKVLIDGISGLDVDNFNVYRIVGLGDGTYKIYLNDNATAIASGSLQAAADAGGNAGAIYNVWQVGLQGGSNFLEADMQTDYLRILSGEARDEAPVPEPGTIALTGLGALCMLIRRR